MRIKFWASTLLLAAAFGPATVWAQRSLQLASGKLLTASAANSQTIFTLPEPSGGTSRLRVARDATVAEGQAPVSLKLVAEIPGSVLILVDTYPSIPGGMSYCQAGEESFLRVLSISGKRPNETYRTKLESCRDNLELASPGLEWLPETRTLEIHWLSAPGKVGKPEDRALKIGADGKTQ
ncbi:MAG: hypothetical protein ABSA78_22265 [Candidatus Sulfotelmatobacter sp.]|jgi:hypothetical protein